jgi:hypothetical protein
MPSQKLYHCNPSNLQVVTRVQHLETKVKSELATLDNVEYTLFADVCYICKDEGEDNELLVCDTCDYNTAHLHCAGFKRVPTSSWVCDTCKNNKPTQKAPAKKRRRRRRYKAKKVGGQVNRKRR